jgi:hypothetical protein
VALADYVTLLSNRLQDTAEIVSQPERQRAVREAVRIYSRQRPQTKVQTITGTGSAFTFTLPVDWETGFSRVLAIEFPVDQQTPEFLDEEQYAVRQAPTAPYAERLQFLDMRISSGKTAYVVYTVAHLVNDQGSDTVPINDREAVAMLAAAICFRALAAYYAQSTVSTIGAESVDHGEKTKLYLEMASAAESTYLQEIGLASKLVGAAAAVMDIDVDMQGLIGDRFWHPRRYR